MKNDNTRKINISPKNGQSDDWIELEKAIEVVEGLFEQKKYERKNAITIN